MIELIAQKNSWEIKKKLFWNNLDHVITLIYQYDVVSLNWIIYKKIPDAICISFIES